MAKSKHFKILAYSNSGEELIFDSLGFKKAFASKEKEINKFNKKTRGGQAILLGEIAKCLYPNYDDKDAEANIPLIKNWLYGRNGPSELEDVRKMEKFFDCDFLIPRPINNASNKGDLSSMNNSVVNMAEISAARELYQLMTDLCRAHQKAMYHFWKANFPMDDQEWLKHVPKDYPAFADIQYKIRRISFDLPEEVRDDTLRLAENLYSRLSLNTEKEEGFPYPDMDMVFDDFLIFLRKNGLDERKWEDSGDVMFEWFEYSNDLTESFYNSLDDIFYAYRR